jgi:hypothetical protein
MIIMGNYRIKLNLEIENKKNPNEETIVKIDVPIENEEATNIDKIEKIMLDINYEAIREAIAKHFEDVSKKNVKMSNQELEEQLKDIVKNTELMER